MHKGGWFYFRPQYHWGWEILHLNQIKQCPLVFCGEIPYKISENLKKNHVPTQVTVDILKAYSSYAAPLEFSVYHCGLQNYLGSVLFLISTADTCIIIWNTICGQSSHLGHVSNHIIPPWTFPKYTQNLVHCVTDPSHKQDGIFGLRSFLTELQNLVEFFKATAVLRYW